MRKGNPNFKKGCKGGPGRPKGSNGIPRGSVLRCREFMEREGWALLENLARGKHKATAVRALEIIAQYGIGRPAQLIDITSGGEALTIRDLFCHDEPELREVRLPEQDQK